MKVGINGLDFSRYRLPRVIPRPYVRMVCQDMPVYIELRTGENKNVFAGLCGIERYAPGVLKLKLIRHPDILVDFNSYGVTWRCWTALPKNGTAEQARWLYDYYSEDIDRVRTRDYVWALPHDYDENW